VNTRAPGSTAEAMSMVLTGLRYMAAADPTALAAQAQAECLQAFERADAISTAARAWFLAAFTTGQGYAEDADYSPTAWLIHRTKVTKGAARGHLGWAHRVQAHPQVALALAEGTVLTDSMARALCGWTDKLPRECRPAADDILLAAARAGARKEDLAGLAAEIYARSLPDEDNLWARRTLAPGSSVITMRWPRRCARWSPTTSNDQHATGGLLRRHGPGRGSFVRDGPKTFARCRPAGTPLPWCACRSPNSTRTPSSRTS